MAVAFVVVLVMVFVMLALFVVVLAFLFVVVLFLVLRHGHVVSASLTVEFISLFCMFCQQVQIGRARSREVATQLIEKKRLEVQRLCTVWHGVGR